MALFIRKRLRLIQETLDEITETLATVVKEIRDMATNPPITQAQFTADLAQLQTVLTKFITDFTAEVAALKAANPAVDFSSLDATVQTMITNVGAADATTGQAPPATTPPAA